MKAETLTMAEKETSESAVAFAGALGTSIAAAMSWGAWHSVWWAIFHGMCSWAYVIYYAIKY